MKNVITFNPSNDFSFIVKFSVPPDSKDKQILLSFERPQAATGDCVLFVKDGYVRFKVSNDLMGKIKIDYGRTYKVLLSNKNGDGSIYNAGKESNFKMPANNFGERVVEGPGNLGNFQTHVEFYALQGGTLLASKVKLNWRNEEKIKEIINASKVIISNLK